MSTAAPDPLSALCLTCGLCCDGTLFKDVELEAPDSAAALTALGLPLQGRKFSQPCAALCADKSCRVYEARPASCRRFECLLLLGAKTDPTLLPAALLEVAATRRVSEKVRTLLRQLGEDREATALSLRFKYLKDAVEAGTRPLDEESADTYAELTLAVRELTWRLTTKFYP